MSEHGDSFDAYQDYKQNKKPIQKPKHASAAKTENRIVNPLKNCPACGNTISKRALSCPHCGWHRLYKQWVFLTMFIIWSMIISTVSILAIIPFLK